MIEEEDHVELNGLVGIDQAALLSIDKCGKMYCSFTLLNILLSWVDSSSFVNLDILHQMIVLWYLL